MIGTELSLVDLADCSVRNLPPAHDRIRQPSGDDGAQRCKRDDNEGDCNNCRHGEAPLPDGSRTGRSDKKERVSALVRGIKNASSLYVGPPSLRPKRVSCSPTLPSTRETARGTPHARPGSPSLKTSPAGTRLEILPDAKAAEHALFLGHNEGIAVVRVLAADFEIEVGHASHIVGERK